MINETNNIKNVLSSLGIQVKEVKHFEYGTSQSTYKIKSGSEFFVIKLFNKDRERFIEQEISHLRQIRRYSNLTIFPLNKKALLAGPKVAYYYKFFDGDRMSGLKIDEIYYKFGKLAAHFDLILQNLPYNKEDFSSHNFLNCNTLIENKNLANGYDTKIANLIKKGQELLKEEFSNKDFSQIRTQFIHKDLHFDNILYNKQLDQYFIIDTAGLSVQFLPKELAVIIGKEFVTIDNKINHRIIHDLLRGYNEFIKFNKIEMESIPLFIIEKKIGELVFLYCQYENNNISEKMFNKYSNLSLRNLQVAVNKYKELRDILLKFDY